MGKGVMTQTPAYDARDLALSEAQEAVHVERFYEHPVDSFYSGMRHAEAVIRKMREGEPHALAIEHANLRQAILQMHRPWYEVGGVRHDHTVYVGDSDRPADHVCRIGGLDACGPEEHYLLACVECRSTTEDGEDGHLLWPCPTARLVLPVANPESSAS